MTVGAVEPSSPPPSYMPPSILFPTGHLPSPESIYIIEVANYSIIEWKPPYFSLNNQSDVMHVDPHITQYTVYITDVYTNNIIEEINVTETRFNFDTLGLDLCLMYQVSAWNAGGEGELSEPVQGRTPQGKLPARPYISTRSAVLALLYCTCSSLPLVPHSIAVENISGVVTAVSNILNIYSGVSLHPLVSFVCMHSCYSTNNETTVQVNTLCTSRIPEFFLITLMNSAGRVLKESNMSHDPGQDVANFNISPPQNVDVCTLHVRIRAGNSAGMSSPSEAVEVGKSQLVTAINFIKD